MLGDMLRKLEMRMGEGKIPPELIGRLKKQQELLPPLQRKAANKIFTEFEAGRIKLKYAVAAYTDKQPEEGGCVWPHAIGR